MSFFIDTRAVEEILLDEGIISDSQFNWARIRQSETSDSLLDILLNEEIIKEDQLLKAWSVKTGFPIIELSNIPLNEESKNNLPISLLMEYKLCPIGIEMGELLMACHKPPPPFILEELERKAGMRISLQLARKDDVEKRLKRFFPDGGANSFQASPSDFDYQAYYDDLRTKNFKDSLADGTIIAMLDRILADGVQQRASDIHFEIGENSARIRFRVDGKMKDVLDMDKRLCESMLSRIKVMADLDITEHQLPLEGRIKHMIQGQQIDFRASVLPGIFGSNVTLRIMNRQLANLDLSVLGFSKRDLSIVEKEIYRTHGLILVTGPTGSGKTTTLYSMITSLIKENCKIVTIEDPVELVIAGTTQMQVKLNKEDESRNLNFAMGLRAALRSDPEVILVGEIRDRETAEIAVNSSLTGHLVISTVHANNAVGFSRRLENLGLKPVSYIDAVNLVVCQRLVRILCPKCKKSRHLHLEDPAFPELLELIGVNNKVWTSVGCDACGGKGFKGRIGIFEVMPMTWDQRKLYISGALSQELTDNARREGMKTIFENCAEKVKEGVTSIEEYVNLMMRGTVNLKD